ncbi:MAG: alpha-E domain-containing protein [Hyphomicrobiaceae bacterium]
MTDLLSRYAECLFWFGRYTERAACLARVLEVQTSINRGTADAETNWGWILTLYDDHDQFAKLYEELSADAVARFYVIDRENPDSLISSIRSGRENARTLRAVISTELWHQVNSFYNRFRNLPTVALTPGRLSPTCQMVKKECYAQLGVAEATLYRDSAWRFFLLGVLVERADQTSRLLDVRFAKRRVGGGDSRTLGDFGFWSVLLRSAAAQQAFLRETPGARDPESVARFLILDPGLPRSVAFSVSEIDRVLNELRQQFHLRAGTGALEQIDILRENLAVASDDEALIDRLHEFNDSIQKQLIVFTEELSYAFFGTDRPAAQSQQSQMSGNGQSQSQSSS